MLSEKSLLILNMIWGQILQEDQMYIPTNPYYARETNQNQMMMANKECTCSHAFGSWNWTDWILPYNCINNFHLHSYHNNCQYPDWSTRCRGGIFGCLQLPLSMHTEPLLKEKQNILQCSPVYGENSFWRWWRRRSVFVDSFEKFFRAAAVVKWMSTVAQLLYGVFYRGGRVFSR